MSKPTVFPLSVITKRINELLQPAISTQFLVRAEISSGSERGGSFYCDLIETDANGKTIAKLRGTIWSQDLVRIKALFKGRDMELVLTNGTAVVFLCSLQFHPQHGISLKVLNADPSFAMGELELRKRAIIEQLQKEGLFEVNKKHVVTMLPLKIGLVTSHSSAAYNDFIHTLSNSGFGFKVYVADAMMQGEQTERAVLKALLALVRLKVELIVIVRGGGSKTDLSFLDNESIARTIAVCPVPVWTGIGHEIDTSVLDYVSNRRFKTPTAVAEELVARFVQMRRQLDESANTLKTVWSYRLKTSHDHLERATTGLQQGARKLWDVTVGHLRELALKLRYSVGRRVNGEQLKCRSQGERLRSLPAVLLESKKEHLVSKKKNLGSGAKSILARTVITFSGIRQRFDRRRFIRRIQAERDNSRKTQSHLQNRFLSMVKVRNAEQKGLKNRFRVEKVKQRIYAESRSLTERMSILRASDPQRVLERGFALVYQSNDRLLRSLHDVNEKDKVRTQFADGSMVSEVVSKEAKL